MTKHWLESDLILAVNVLYTTLYLLLAKVVYIYYVPSKTLAARLYGIPLRKDYITNSRKITPLEESVIIRYILDLDS